MQVGLRNEEVGGPSAGFFLQRRIGIAIPVTVEENRVAAEKEDMDRSTVIRRSELWRSMRTDGVQIALRRVHFESPRGLGLSRPGAKSTFHHDTAAWRDADGRRARSGMLG